MIAAQSNVIELRQYTLHPGKRDELIELFEREFIESQEALGMEIVGTFRDADNPDRFVWLRGFPDMESRARSLAAFYGGPVWKANREAANATMIDSDNVLLLRPAWSGSGFRSAGARTPRGAAKAPPGVVVATILYFVEAVAAAWLASFRRQTDTGIAALVTEPSANTFPALPVREGENVFVHFALFAGVRSARAAAIPPELERQAMRIETLRLLPTSRSRLHA